MTHTNMNTPTPDYGELWTIQEGHLSTSLFDGKGDYFADIHELVGEDSSVAWAKAERIVACVNACTGMTDPAKEIAELRAALSGRTVSCGQCNDYAAKIEGMREAIREAQKSFQSIYLDDIFDLTMKEIARAALAKLQPFLK